MTPKARRAGYRPGAYPAQQLSPSRGWAPLFEATASPDRGAAAAVPSAGRPGFSLAERRRTHFGDWAGRRGARPLQAVCNGQGAGCCSEPSADTARRQPGATTGRGGNRLIPCGRWLKRETVCVVTCAPAGPAVTLARLLYLRGCAETLRAAREGTGMHKVASSTAMWRSALRRLRRAETSALAAIASAGA